MKIVYYMSIGHCPISFFCRWIIQLGFHCIDATIIHNKLNHSEEKSDVFIKLNRYVQQIN